MSIENGEWVIKGLEYDDPGCLHSPRELITYINQVGFLPLFGNEIPGFSVEEHTWYAAWWSGDRDDDPWEWREQIARSREVAYGKFFNKKAGFISLAWLPYFANYRRDGYDFDSLYEEGLASARAKKIMDQFLEGGDAEAFKTEPILSTQLKKLAGFGKEGEKNYPGVLTELQMRLYLVAVDFRRRQNRKGESFGMAVSAILPPEAVWGYDAVTAAYGEAPETSRDRIVAQIRKLYPDASEKTAFRMAGVR